MKSPLSRTWGVSLSRVVKLLLLALAPLILFALLVMMFGSVEGEEFSPQTFDRRRYTFYCVPFTRWQISPTFRTDYSSSLESKLRGDQLVRTSSPETTRWDLVSVGSSFGRDRAAAALLTDILDGYSAYGWEEWTDQHAARAKLLWPAVQETAELGAYELLPDLFELASWKTTDDEFPQQLRQHLANAYQQLAGDYSREGDASRAQQLRDAASRYAGTP